MRVQVTDVSTDPRGRICQATDGKAFDYCFNGFGDSVQLTDEWRRYTLDFSQFVQRSSWAITRRAASTGAVSTRWSSRWTCRAARTLRRRCARAAPLELSFDIWIDDIYFVNK